MRGDGTPPPIACSLDAAAVPGRLEAWRVTLTGCGPVTRPEAGMWRVQVDTCADVPALAALVVAEQACCPFLSFALTVDDRGIGLEVRAPEDAEPVVDALLGEGR